MIIYQYPPQPAAAPVLGAATSANQVLQLTQETSIAGSVSAINTKTPALVSGSVPVTGPLTDTQLRASALPVSMASAPLPTGAATEATLNAVKTSVELIDNTIATDGGAATSQILAIGGHTGTTSHAWHVDASGLGRVDVRASALPTGAATSALQTEISGEIGILTETAPATDTASSGLNGRLQRIAQRLTSLIALFPVTLGQKTMANSFAVTLASDQSALPVSVAAQTPTFQEILNLTTTALTFTAPANAKWCKVYADDTNAANIRVKIGGAATITSGIQFQPGRSEDYSAVGNISVIAESGTNQKICVQFGV